MNMSMKNRKSKARLAWLTTAVCLAVSSSVYAMPVGGVASNAEITVTQEGSQVAEQIKGATINSGATINVGKTGVINWQAFGIGANESLNFDLGSNSLLNRVAAGGPASEILGKMAATGDGRLLVVNPNGITIGAGATIDVNNLLMSTLNVSDADFYNFANGKSANFTTVAGKGEQANKLSIKYNAKIGKLDANGNLSLDQLNNNLHLLGGSVTIADGVKISANKITAVAGTSYNPNTEDLKATADNAFRILGDEENVNRTEIIANNQALLAGGTVAIHNADISAEKGMVAVTATNARNGKTQAFTNTVNNTLSIDNSTIKGSLLSYSDDYKWYRTQYGTDGQEAWLVSKEDREKIKSYFGGSYPHGAYLYGGQVDLVDSDVSAHEVNIQAANSLPTSTVHTLGATDNNTVNIHGGKIEAGAKTSAQNPGASKITIDNQDYYGSTAGNVQIAGGTVTIGVGTDDDNRPSIIAHGSLEIAAGNQIKSDTSHAAYTTLAPTSAQGRYTTKVYNKATKTYDEVEHTGNQIVIGDADLQGGNSLTVIGGSVWATNSNMKIDGWEKSESEDYNSTYMVVGAVNSATITPVKPVTGGEADITNTVVSFSTKDSLGDSNRIKLQNTNLGFTDDNTGDHRHSTIVFGHDSKILGSSLDFETKDGDIKQSTLFVGAGENFTYNQGQKIASLTTGKSFIEVPDSHTAIPYGNYVDIGESYTDQGSVYSKFVSDSATRIMAGVVMDNGSTIMTRQRALDGYNGTVEISAVKSFNANERARQFGYTATADNKLWLMGSKVGNYDVVPTNDNEEEVAASQNSEYARRVDTTLVGGQVKFENANVNTQQLKAFAGNSIPLASNTTTVTATKDNILRAHGNTTINAQEVDLGAGKVLFGTRYFDEAHYLGGNIVDDYDYHENNTPSVTVNAEQLGIAAGNKLYYSQANDGQYHILAPSAATNANATVIGEDANINVKSHGFIAGGKVLGAEGATITFTGADGGRTNNTNKKMLDIVAGSSITNSAPVAGETVQDNHLTVTGTNANTINLDGVTIQVAPSAIDTDSNLRVAGGQVTINGSEIDLTGASWSSASIIAGNNMKEVKVRNGKEWETRTQISATGAKNKENKLIIGDNEGNATTIKTRDSLSLFGGQNEITNSNLDSYKIIDIAGTTITKTNGKAAISGVMGTGNNNVLTDVGIENPDTVFISGNTVDVNGGKYTGKVQFGIAAGTSAVYDATDSAYTKMYANKATAANKVTVGTGAYGGAQLSAGRAITITGGNVEIKDESDLNIMDKDSSHVYCTDASIDIVAAPNITLNVPASVEEDVHDLQWNTTGATDKNVINLSHARLDSNGNSMKLDVTLVGGKIAITDGSQVNASSVDAIAGNSMIWSNSTSKAAAANDITISGDETAVTASDSINLHGGAININSGTISRTGDATTGKAITMLAGSSIGEVAPKNASKYNQVLANRTNKIAIGDGAAISGNVLAAAGQMTFDNNAKVDGNNLEFYVANTNKLYKDHAEFVANSTNDFVMNEGSNIAASGDLRIGAGNVKVSGSIETQDTTYMVGSNRISFKDDGYLLTKKYNMVGQKDPYTFSLEGDAENGFMFKFSGNKSAISQGAGGAYIMKRNLESNYGFNGNGTYNPADSLLTSHLMMSSSTINNNRLFDFLTVTTPMEYLAGNNG